MLQGNCAGSGGDHKPLPGPDIEVDGKALVVGNVILPHVLDRLQGVLRRKGGDMEGPSGHGRATPYQQGFSPRLRGRLGQRTAEGREEPERGRSNGTGGRGKGSGGEERGGGLDLCPGTPVLLSHGMVSSVNVIHGFVRLQAESSGGRWLSGPEKGKGLHGVVRQGKGKPLLQAIAAGREE